MLIIHKPLHKKLFFLVITSIGSIGALLGLSFLAYTPELSHAETVTYGPIPRYHPNIYDVTYMQDMTEQVCQNSYENDTKQLIDVRNNKTYWVTKLKDGNCWMTQNLALDLNTSKTLTSTDSDVSSNWTPPANTQQGTITKFPNNSNLTFSYNPGEYIYTTPIMQYHCGTSGITSLAECPSWQAVARLSQNTTGDERSHYLSGNYYSYNIATAGHAAGGSSASNSICPKGWTLPTGGISSSQYSTLVNGLTSSITDNTNNIKLAPYYFVVGGHVTGGSLYATDAQGSYWSSTTADALHAYNLFFFHASINTSNTFQFVGMTIRCIARGDTLARPAISSENNIVININPQISMDAANEVVVEKSENNPSTTDLNVKVSSNQPYTVAISSNDPAMRSSAASVAIPAKSGLLNAPENGWGIKKSEDTSYTALTTSPQTFYTASGAEIKTIPFTIGISTAPDIPNGEYSTNITITATQN